MQNKLLYKEAENIIYLKAEGHITANLCYVLRKKIFTRFNNQQAVSDIFIDLSKCDYMDSTFIGILIGINKKFYSMYGKKMQIVCPTMECNKLFSGLGLMSLLSIKNKTTPFPPDMEIISPKEKATARDILNAHNELMETSEDNKNKFKLLKEILEKKLDPEK